MISLCFILDLIYLRKQKIKGAINGHTSKSHVEAHGKVIHEMCDNFAECILRQSKSILKLHTIARATISHKFIL